MFLLTFDLGLYLSIVHPLFVPPLPLSNVLFAIFVLFTSTTIYYGLVGLVY
jgi:hypothetical protein